jgi:hypothetical protein
MRIIVVLSSGSTKFLNVQPTITIKELKHITGAQLGIKIKHSIFNYGTLMLDEETDEKTLMDIDIENDGMIHVTSSYLGGFNFE